MELHTFQYLKNQGWTKPFPKIDSKNTLAIIFASPEYKNNISPLQEFAEFYKDSHIIGCSSSGEIYKDTVHDQSLSVALIRFDSTALRSFKIENKDIKDSLTSGKKIADSLNHDKLRSVFVLSEGLNVNGSELAKGLNNLKTNDIIITGGLGGDGHDFKQTWTIYKGQICYDTIVAVGFYGNKVNINYASRGGWDMFGPERRITHAVDNKLYEIDSQPALALYKQYLGDRAKELPSSGLLFPLGIRKDQNDQTQLVRTILSVDEKEQSLTFAGDMPKGYLAQFMRANFDRLITSAGESGEDIKKSHNLKTKSGDILCLAISCVGRRLLLGERSEEEIEAVLKNLPQGSQMIGFYSYGELSPHSSKECSLHNQTMTLTTLNED